jgi:hypothetical protein
MDDTGIFHTNSRTIYLPVVTLRYTKSFCCTSLNRLIRYAISPFSFPIRPPVSIRRIRYTRRISITVVSVDQLSNNRNIKPTTTYLCIRIRISKEEETVTRTEHMTIPPSFSFTGRKEIRNASRADGVMLGSSHHISYESTRE